ncbi:MAG: hypothetical protein H0W84_05960, partial [Bacteroidetes bacterium]|nr:hypothetical protein [Bacteroidota bacterium]
MKPTDDLFLLIKSLGKAEKRYFKLFITFQSGAKNYKRLFDAIDKQKTFNEKKILLQFKSEHFIRQVSVTKNYLYKMILKCMSLYHSGKSLTSEIIKLIEYIEVLYFKGHYKQAWKFLERAKKLAVEHEKFNLLPELYEWERKLLRIERNNKERLLAISGDIEKATKEIINQNQYQDISSKLWVQFAKSGKARTKETVAIFSKLFDKPLLETESKATSFLAKFYFNNSHIFYYRAMGDYKKAHQYSSKNISLFANASEFTKISLIDKYTSCLYNHLITSI